MSITSEPWIGIGVCVCVCGAVLTYESGSSGSGCELADLGLVGGLRGRDLMPDHKKQGHGHWAKSLTNVCGSGRPCV